MTNLIIISLATAFIITAVEELLIVLGKWRGLAAFVLSLMFSYFVLEHLWGRIIVISLSASFLGMTCSMLVRTLLEVNDTRTIRGVPRRVPPL
ncbi:MAG: hypothetical protein EBX50_07930 [Chitinophagia bacterium]|nr:hypothetical protein [Chitinophagia bacterium]